MRSRGEGSLFQRSSDGLWVGSVSLPDGRLRRVYAKTQREAREKLRTLQAEVRAGRAIPAGRAQTLDAYLDEWTTIRLQQKLTAGRLKESTVDSYRETVRLHIKPGLGTVPLAKLSPRQVREWLHAKAGVPNRRGTMPSARSLAYMHAVLRTALSDAMRDELVTRNVAQLVEAPRGRKRTVQPLTPAEATKIFKAAADDSLRALWFVYLGLGLRRGEALGLRWSDVDLDERRLTISRSLQRLRGEADPKTGRRVGRLVEVDPKTKDSAATIALPAMVASALRDHQLAQRKARMAADAWLDPELVFTSAAGTYLDPQSLRYPWRRLCKEAGVRVIRLHDLRHSAASFMLAAGVDLKVVQSVLRHSRLATTADIYTHVLDEVGAESAVLVDGILRKLTDGSSPDG